MNATMKRKIPISLMFTQGILMLAGLCSALIPYAALWFLVKGNYSIGAISFQNMGFSFEDFTSADLYKNPLFLFVICLVFCVFLSTQLASLVGSLGYLIVMKSLSKLFGKQLMSRFESIKAVKSERLKREYVKRTEAEERRRKRRSKLQKSMVPYLILGVFSGSIFF